jgi:formylglycine-generating enzyme required for sulfatase activity
MHPAQSVLLPNCVKYCKALGKLVDGEFRLPSEAEWENACRAGTCGGVYLGEDEVDRASWHADNSNGHTHPVAEKKPNAWDLYDMLGNVWDWCSDGDQASDGDPTDPVGPNKGRRIVKGGAWRSAVGRCRAPTRYAEESRRRTDDQGFRVVMVWQ